MSHRQCNNKSYKVSYHQEEYTGNNVKESASVSDKHFP